MSKEKFQLKKIEPRKKVRSPQVGFRLTEDLVGPFHNQLEKSGLSLAQVVNSMIRHCLKDLGEDV